MPQTAASYLASLPEVETSRMPVGTLFIANNLIYQVVEADPGGHARARLWRQGESTDVALVPGSFLARTLPVVKTGRMLPVYRSRKELLSDGQTTGFVFPTETLAKDAAYLDVSLIITTGAYVRAQGHDPAFAVTDGVQIYRLYYYGSNAIGRVVENPHCELRLHTEGSAYWRLLPSWKESFPSSKATQLSMSPVTPSSPITPISSPTQPLQQGHQTASMADTTQVTRAIRPDDPTPAIDANDADPDATMVSKAVRKPIKGEADDETREHKGYQENYQGGGSS